MTIYINRLGPHEEDPPNSLIRSFDSLRKLCIVHNARFIPRFCCLRQSGPAWHLLVLPSIQVSHAHEVLIEGAGANSNAGIVCANSLLLSIWDVPGRRVAEISNFLPSTMLVGFITVTRWQGKIVRGWSNTLNRLPIIWIKRLKWPLVARYQLGYSVAP